MKKLVFYFTCKTFYFFSRECLVNCAHLPQSNLTKMVMPRTATHLFFFNSNGLVLITWTLPISFNISKLCIYCTSIPQRELKILSQRKRTREAIKPYLLKMLEGRKMFAFRNNLFNFYLGHMKISKNFL